MRVPSWQCSVAHSQPHRVYLRDTFPGPEPQPNAVREDEARTDEIGLRRVGAARSRRPEHREPTPCERRGLCSGG